MWEVVTRRYPKFENYDKTTDKMPIYILQAISLYYNRTSACKREDILNIYQNVFEPTNMEFEAIWFEASDYINKAIHKLENLRDGFGVKDENQLPFAPIIPILAMLIKEIETRQNKIDCNKKVSIWYWSSVFSNAYSGAVDTQLTSDFKEMKAWFSNNDMVPKTVDKARRELGTLNLLQVKSRGSALYKGVLSLLALEGAKDFDTKEVLENAQYNDKDHLFPLEGFNSARDVNSVLNMTWMSDETNRKVKRYEKPSNYIRKFTAEKYAGNEKEFQEVLKTHLVNMSAYECMVNDDFEGFITERDKIIFQKIKELIVIEEPIQRSGLISPNTPFSNKMMISKTIESCNDYIFWVDKFFHLEGLRLLMQSLESSKVKSIKILTSIDKADDNLRRSFKDFRDEMKNNQVMSELRVIADSKLKSSIHDRWLISKNNCFNIPSPDVVARGQYSEIKSTQNRPPFDDWWDKSLNIIDDWDQIQNSRSKPL
jgi:hypothetical protein